MAEQMKQNKAGEMAAKQIIPAGYKLSEAGIIPEDWEALPLGGICKVQGGFAFKSERFKKTGVPILRISNIQSGYLDVNEVVYYSVGEKIPKQFEVNDGDALIAMSGATTGKVGIYNENGVAYLNQRVGKFVLHGNADIRYIQHVVGSDLYKIALNNMLAQGAQPNISSSQLERIVIRKPTIEIEQKIIADVLSDTDKLIACLAQLIAKKQAIKTAAMQQLLTGRTRLPQFALRPDGTPKGYKSSELGQIPEDWVLADIRSISAVPMQNGLFYEPIRKGKGVPLINVGDMYTAAPVDVGLLELFDASLNEIKLFKAVRGDLFFTRSSVVPSGIAYCNIFDSERNDVVFDSHLIRVRPNVELVDPKYLYLSCISKYARSALIAEAKTATMTTIDQGAINSCPVLVPPKNEQTAIATILSDMDNELQALTQKLEKARALKQGMMQQLLTGRIRLPLEVVA